MKSAEARHRPGRATWPQAPSRLTATFWGTRGSYPVSHSDFARFGGNTACVEVRLGDRLFIVDAGSKSLSSDLGAHGSGGSGFGIAVCVDDCAQASWEVERLSEEHGFVRFADAPPAIGSRVRIFPNHSCAVVAQFDNVTLRPSDGGAVTLRVDARGRQT